MILTSNLMSSSSCGHLKVRGQHDLIGKNALLLFESTDMASLLVFDMIHHETKCKQYGYILAQSLGMVAVHSFSGHSCLLQRISRHCALHRSLCNASEHCHVPTLWLFNCISPLKCHSWRTVDSTTLVNFSILFPRRSSMAITDSGATGTDTSRTRNQSKEIIHDITCPGIVWATDTTS